MEKFDKYGRLKYDPDIHENQGTRWTEDDLQYLIDYYYKLGPTEMSFALGRALTTVQQKAYQLRKLGRLVMPDVVKQHKRYKEE